LETTMRQTTIRRTTDDSLSASNHSPNPNPNLNILSPVVR